MLERRESNQESFLLFLSCVYVDKTYQRKHTETCPRCSNILLVTIKGLQS